jgi:cytochrome c biogenesis protein ResB
MAHRKYRGYALQGRAREMKSDILKRPWRWLASPGVLAVLIVALLAVMLLGTLLPQLPEVAPGTAQLAEWQALAQARYGALTPFLEAAGAYRLYRTPLLWVPLALLAVATLSCVVQRWQGYWRAAFGQPVRLPETTLGAASHACIIEPSSGHDPERLDALSDMVRRALDRRDYRVRAEGASDAVWLRGDRNRLSRLGTLAEHLAVLLVLAGVGVSLVFGWRETFMIEPGRTAEVGHATGIALRNDGFEIERYADGSPAAYRAQVTVESGEEIQRRKIGVNQPAVQRGARLYLQGYRPMGDRYIVTLLAVHDPGYGVAVGGGILFLASIVVALYCPRSSVHIRISGDGTLRLAGWADRRAYDFDREFAGLVTDLHRESDSQRQDSASPGAE